MLTEAAIIFLSIRWITVDHPYKTLSLNFNSLCKHVEKIRSSQDFILTNACGESLRVSLINFLISLLIRAGAITWENFVPAKWDAGSKKQSSGGVLKKGIPKNFAKFTEIPLCQSLFFLILTPYFFRQYSCLFHFKRKFKWKKGNNLMKFKYLLSCSSIDLFDVKYFKRNLADGNLIRKSI